MVENEYYQAIDKLEKMGVDEQYIQGWASGYMQCPQKEEQRVTPAYAEGYEDGLNRKTSRAENWK